MDGVIFALDNRHGDLAIHALAISIGTQLCRFRANWQIDKRPHNDTTLYLYQPDCKSR